MGSNTGTIRFNVKNRGRKYRGQDRNFDTEVLADIINSGDVQERVKSRDLLGYFGHWPRAKFGMNPIEGAIVDGKPVSLEPAIVTTKLVALPDGTIEHESEFLDTNAGRLAERLFKSNTGGFSSAIDAKRCGDQLVPIGFYGFDYVLEPNFNGNRGFQVVLDSSAMADEKTLALMDEVGDYMSLLDAANSLYEKVQRAYDLQSEAMKALEEENAELISQLAMIKSTPVLDSANGRRILGGGERRILSAMSAFDGVKNLPGFVAIPDESKKDPSVEAALNIVDRMYG